MNLAIPFGVVTLGGVTTGISILAWHLTRWWKTGGKKDIKHLVALTLCTLYGILLILTTGGLLGGLAGVALWGGNVAGDAALEYGVGGGTPEVTRGSPLTLTDGGHAFVIVVTVVLIAVWSRRRGFRVDLATCIFAGVCLGLARGVAGWAATVLGPVVSVGGDWIVGLL